MIENTSSLLALMKACHGDAVRSSFSAADTSYALRIPRGQLLIWQGVTLPIVGGKTSVDLFGEVHATKCAPLLTMPLPLKSATTLSKGIFLKRTTNYFHFMIFHLPTYIFIHALPDAVPISIFSPPLATPPTLDLALPTLIGQLSGGRATTITTLPEGGYDLEDIIVPLTGNVTLAVAFHRQITLPMCEAQLVGALGSANNRPLKLFLRRESSSRRLINSEEVERWFTTRNYIAIDPGSMSLAEQALMFARASHIAGVEGAAFTNLLFAVKAVKVVMLASVLVKAESFFARIAGVAAIPFETVYGRVPGNNMLRSSDFFIDTSHLDRLEQDGKL